MDCDEHDKDKKAQNKLFGKQCLDDHLAANGDKCPIGGHKNASPAKNKFVEGMIDDLMAKCPRAAHGIRNPSF